MAIPHKINGMCMGCNRYQVTATLVGRLDGVAHAGVQRDKAGKITSIAGFGNLNGYPAQDQWNVHGLQPVPGDCDAGGTAGWRGPCGRAAGQGGEDHEHCGVWKLEWLSRTRSMECAWAATGTR